tara:strand:+ start:102 stop:434 length:333 start_codon:yes stop_codon:yes gene_type:complete
MRKSELRRIIREELLREGLRTSGDDLHNAYEDTYNRILSFGQEIEKMQYGSFEAIAADYETGELTGADAPWYAESPKFKKRVANMKKWATATNKALNKIKADYKKVWTNV